MFWRKVILLPLLEIEPRFLGRPDRSLLTIPTEPYACLERQAWRWWHAVCLGWSTRIFTHSSKNFVSISDTNLYRTLANLRSLLFTRKLQRLECIATLNPLTSCYIIMFHIMRPSLRILPLVVGIHPLFRHVVILTTAAIMLPAVHTCQHLDRPLICDCMIMNQPISRTWRNFYTQKYRHFLSYAY